jgi:alkylhydroperoxidase family enzyme
VTEAPAMIGDSDFENLRSAGWDERGIYEASVLISFFNMTGRIEAVSGLPPDEIPDSAPMREAMDVSSAAAGD